MRTTRRRRTKIAGQFAPRLIEMLESPAHRVLSLSGHRILYRVEIELAQHGGTDNGNLPVTYQHFMEFGMDRDCIAPAIREVVALGFMEVTVRGRAGNAEFRHPNRFRLTYRHTDKADPTDEWRKIDTIKEAQGIARAARSKQNSNRGLSVVSVGKPPTENTTAPPGETPTTSPPGETPTTSISRVRGASHKQPRATAHAVNGARPAP